MDEQTVWCLVLVLVKPDEIDSVVQCSVVWCSVADGLDWIGLKDMVLWWCHDRQLAGGNWEEIKEGEEPK